MARQLSIKLISGQVTRGTRDGCGQGSLLPRAIEATPDYGHLKGCDLIVEAVFEDRAVKAEADEARTGRRRRRM